MRVCCLCIRDDTNTNTAAAAAAAAAATISSSSSLSSSPSSNSSSGRGTQRQQEEVLRQAALHRIEAIGMMRIVVTASMRRSDGLLTLRCHEPETVRLILSLIYTHSAKPSPEAQTQLAQRLRPT